MEEKKECCHKTKERSEKEFKDLVNRLNRIEGQIRGIKRMVESDTYCTDILIQVSAVNAALNSFNKVLLANHIRTCVEMCIRDRYIHEKEVRITMKKKITEVLGIDVIPNYWDKRYVKNLDKLSRAMYEVEYHGDVWMTMRDGVRLCADVYPVSYTHLRKCSKDKRTCKDCK